MEKYFMHRIKEENGAFVAGIEVHATKDAAILSFWGYMAVGFNNPEYPGVTLVACKITDIHGNVIKPYDLIWRKNPNEIRPNTFFMHHIRQDGDAFNKGIDVLADFDAAKLAYSKALIYGYGNPKFPDVGFVSCMITDRSGAILEPYCETWAKPEPASESQPEQTPAAE